MEFGKGGDRNVRVTGQRPEFGLRSELTPEDNWKKLLEAREGNKGLQEAIGAYVDACHSARTAGHNNKMHLGTVAERFNEMKELIDAINKGRDEKEKLRIYNTRDLPPVTWLGYENI